MRPRPDPVSPITSTNAFVDPEGVSGKNSLTSTAFWDGQWIERGGRSLLGQMLHRSRFGPRGLFLRAMERNAPGVFRGAKVVELGGAASAYLVDLARNEHAAVTAIDYSEVGVAQTKELFRSEGIEGRVIFADIFALRDYDAEFDVVTHWGLLEHFEDPSPIIEVSARLLKTGGHLVFTMPNLSAHGAALWKHLSPENFRAHVFHDNAGISAALHRSGLTLVNVFHYGSPLIRMAPPERTTLLSVVANAAHGLALLIGCFSPALYTSGNSSYSNTRGFVAVKL